MEPTALVLFFGFWSLLLLPGLALLRRCGGMWLDGGIPASIAVCYLVSFAVLTPVAVIGYLFALPLKLLSIAYGVTVAAAILDLSWRARETSGAWLRALPRRAWAARSSMAAWVGLAVFALVLADMIVATRVGSYPTGDAYYHTARVRSLMTQGFVNWNPMIASRPFDQVYHTNLYHALIACSANIARLQSIEAWAYMLAWVKLVTGGAAAQLAYCLFRSKPVALLACAATVPFWLSQRIATYPNNLAVLWLMPMAVGFAVELLGEGRKRAAFGIALVGLALAQVHSLYYAFTCLVLGPTFLLGGVILLARRQRSGAKAALLGMLALVVGLPWFAVSATQRGHVQLQPPPQQHTRARRAVESPPPRLGLVTEESTYRGFVLLPGERMMLDPSPLTDPTDVTPQLLLAVALALLGRSRNKALAVLAMLLTVLVVLFVPALCTALVKLAGAPWIVRRLWSLPTVLGVALVASSLPALLAERGWLRGAVLGLSLPLVLAYGFAFGIDELRWSRAEYVTRAKNPERLNGELRDQRELAELLGPRVAAGANVLSSHDLLPIIPRVSDGVPYALPVFVGSHGATDMEFRRNMHYVMLARRLPAYARARILYRYEVYYVVLWRNLANMKIIEDISAVASDKVASRRFIFMEIKHARTR